ncbi:unnamed protein product [Fusarium graminearum]|uniref:Chromosome 3, complete genome n=1 Tax=Gibberella zeae (strain ATCC MYA-4620 / CBS 123657 / FGSC 9075 / NRRL 31084 / PH-1) TaxID=229533 RepID=A0A098DZA7_GIBZE|nr:unnamed protein product [Fusarium graminearum]
MPANGISTPSPIQNGISKNCNKFHKIQSTTTYISIENYYNNPAIGKNCESLLTNYWVCVGVVGWSPPTKTKTTTTKAATTTKPSNGISTPLPIQANMSAQQRPARPSRITIPSLYQTLGSGILRSVLTAQTFRLDNVCVGVIGGTPTKPSDGIKTPSPIQPKMTTNCKKFHKVASTTTCASIQKYYKITMAQLLKWNPTVGSGCEKLWADYWVCVGV